ncbi:MAG: O-antigen ligase family protein [Parcubacteria group bacterium]
MIYKLLLLFCLYIPFQIALNPAEGVDLASGRVFILILALMWLISALKNRQVCVPVRIQTFLILSFLFLSAFSLLWARNTDWSLRKLLFLLSIFPIYFITTAISKSDFDRIKIIKFLTWGAGLAALVGLIQFALQFIWGLNNILKFWAGTIAPVFLGTAFSEAVLAYPSWLVNLGGKTIFRATATFPDPHMLSIYLGMALPLALGLFWTSDVQAKRAKDIRCLGGRKIYLILSGVILLADLLSFSRGGYIGLAAGLLFFLAVIVWKKKVNFKKALIGFVLMFVFFVSILNSPIGNRFLTSFNAKEGSNQGRLEMWKEAVEIIKNNPLGVGLGNYALEIKATADYREPFYAHNLYLDIAAETGILNTIIWIALIIFSISGFIKKSKSNVIWLAGATSLVIFSAHSLFETALFSVQALPFLLIVIALGAVKTDGEK